MKKIFFESSPLKLFIIIFALPWGTQLVFLIFFMGLNHILAISSINNFIIINIYLSWLYFLGVNLNRKVPEKIRSTSILFKISLIYLLVYSGIITVIFVKVSTRDPSSLDLLPVINSFSFNFLAMIFMFYAVYFTARSYAFCLKTENLGISKPIATFFLFWIYPAGIWALQPNIQRIFITKKTNN